MVQNFGIQLGTLLFWIHSLNKLTKHSFVVLIFSAKTLVICLDLVPSNLAVLLHALQFFVGDNDICLFLIRLTSPSISSIHSTSLLRSTFYIIYHYKIFCFVQCQEFHHSSHSNFSNNFYGKFSNNCFFYNWLRIFSCLLKHPLWPYSLANVKIYL